MACSSFSRCRRPCSGARHRRRCRRRRRRYLESGHACRPAGWIGSGRATARAGVPGRGHDVVVLARRPGPGAAPVVAWDGETLGPWAAELDGADVVINLAGRSVNCRYTPAQPRRDHRLAGRLDARGRRGHRAGRAPAARVAAGQHGDDLRPPLEPRTTRRPASIGGHEPGRPRHVAVQHRGRDGVGARADEAASTPRTRKIALRSAMTMSPDRGGVFDTLLGLVRRGLGGTRGRRPAVRVVGPPRGLRRGPFTG